MTDYLKILQEKQKELDKHKNKNYNSNQKLAKSKYKDRFKHFPVRTKEDVAKWEREQKLQPPVREPVQLHFFKDFEKCGEEEVGVMPNTIARSALFAPIKRGKRRYIDKGIIASRKDVEIIYSGLQLDVSDADVFMQAIKLAAEHNLGSEFQIIPYGFLQKLGKGGKRKRPGKNDLIWLQKSLERLKKGVLTVETDKYRVLLSLIDDYAYDKKTGVHQIRINPKIITLFNREQYGAIDWNKRKKIGIDLGKWLQTYVASNSGKQKIGIEKIKIWSGQEKTRKGVFKTKLINAFKKLEQLGIVKKFNFDQNTQILTYEAIKCRDNSAIMSG